MAVQFVSDRRPSTKVPPRIPKNRSNGCCAVWGLTPAEAAARSGSGTRSVYAWCSGAALPPRMAILALRHLADRPAVDRLGIGVAFSAPRLSPAAPHPVPRRARYAPHERGAVHPAAAGSGSSPRGTRRSLHLRVHTQIMGTGYEFLIGGGEQLLFEAMNQSLEPYIRPHVHCRTPMVKPARITARRMRLRAES